VADPDPFDLLGVPESASDRAIRAAWRRLIRKSHPDNAADEADRRARLARSIALNRARDVLLDPALKADALLGRHRRATAAGQAAYRPPEPAPTRWQARDTWDGSGWTTSSQAGGPSAGSGPHGSAQPANRALRILAVTVRVFGAVPYALVRTPALVVLGFAVVLASWLISPSPESTGAALSLLMIGLAAYVLLHESSDTSDKW
jgi:hypothetical protein